jgi:hypothetical protein
LLRNYLSLGLKWLREAPEEFGVGNSNIPSDTNGANVDAVEHVTILRSR